MEKIYSNEIIKAFPIFQAVKDGKTIQTIDEMGYWYDLDLDEDGLSLETLINSPRNYRIKPEPTYRPFANAEECWKEMQKHEPFGWVKNIEFAKYFLIDEITSLFSDAQIHISAYEGKNWSCFSTVFHNYTFADGTPFGILEEEQL